MYDENGCCSNFDSNAMPEAEQATPENGFSQTVLNINSQLPNLPPSLLISGNSNETHNNNIVSEEIKISMEELPNYHLQNYHQPSHEDVAATAMDYELQQHMEIIDNSYSNNINGTTNTQLMSFEQSNWETNGIPQMQELDDFNHHHHQITGQLLPEAVGPYPPAPDLLNLFHLPRSSTTSSLLPNSSITFTNPTQRAANFQNSLGFLGDLPTGHVVDTTSASSVLYDPLFHLNLPPQQPPLFRELFQSLPNGYSLPTSRNDSLFSSGGDEREGSAGVYQDGDGRPFENGVLEFTQRGQPNKKKQHFATEKHRRKQLNDKYVALKNLVPSPTKVLILFHYSLFKNIRVLRWQFQFSIRFYD